MDHDPLSDLMNEKNVSYEEFIDDIVETSSVIDTDDETGSIDTSEDKKLDLNYKDDDNWSLYENSSYSQDDTYEKDSFCVSDKSNVSAEELTSEEEEEDFVPLRKRQRMNDKKECVRNNIARPTPKAKRLSFSDESDDEM